MSGPISDYCALTTKIRAMYGRRLRYSDFISMAAMEDLPSILDYLRQTCWAPAVAKLDLLPNGRSHLEGTLRGQVREEYLRLLAFAPRSDKALMAYPVWLAELELILTTLRRLKSGHSTQTPAVPDGFLTRSKLNAQQLMRCGDFDGLASATQGTIYGVTLANLRAERPGQLPDYQMTESLLYTVYYTHLFQTIGKQYTGETKKTLLRDLGMQIDLLNIVHILRLKQYFPQDTNILPHLFSFHDQLTPAMLQQLADAPSLEAAFALLKNTRYASTFHQAQVKEVEDYYRKAVYTRHHRQLMGSSQSVATAISYLHLKQVEMTALITLIESVNYGVAFDDSLVRLIGD